MNIVNDNMSDTPETDAAWKEGNAIREWTCRKLERERDEAREEWGKASMDAAQLLSEKTKVMAERDEALEELEEYRSIAENIGAEKAISEKEKAIRERDELQMAVNGLCLHLGVSPSNTTLLAVEVLRIQREREEAITRRMETIMQCELYEQERDEAREESQRLRVQLNHFWQANEMAEQAFRERDEALEEIKNLKLQLGLWEDGNIICEETLGEIRLFEEQIKQALLERNKAYKIAEKAIDDLAWFNETNSKRLGNELKQLKEETREQYKP